LLRSRSVAGRGVFTGPLPRSGLLEARISLREVEMGARPFSIRARRVLAGGVERAGWWVTVAGGLITACGPNPPRGTDEIDLADADLIPGVIDLYSDALERLRALRAGSDPAMLDAVLELDGLLAAAGITTAFLRVESPDVIDLLGRIRPVLRFDARVHLRVDPSPGRIADAERLMERGAVAAVSCVDHTTRRWAITGKDTPGARALAPLRRLRIASLAARYGVRYFAQDVDTADDVAEAAGYGATVCGFPRTQDVARAARERGLGTVLGAPNALRGAGHPTRISARDAYELGLLDALASDHHPGSLLLAAYVLTAEDICSWAQALELATAEPARLAGLSDRGVIEPGRRADLVAVVRRLGRPLVEQSWVGGVATFASRVAPAGVAVQPVAELVH
jgi:alpha-D-ribose 1-methylphosphonate 5-triphosphate diphosphatase